MEWETEEIIKIKCINIFILQRLIVNYVLVVGFFYNIKSLFCIDDGESTLQLNSKFHMKKEKHIMLTGVCLMKG